MVIFVCLGEIKKIIGNDYEVTVMVPAGKYFLIRLQGPNDSLH